MLSWILHLASCSIFILWAPGRWRRFNVIFTVFYRGLNIPKNNLLTFFKCFLNVLHGLKKERKLLRDAVWIGMISINTLKVSPLNKGEILLSSSVCVTLRTKGLSINWIAASIFVASVQNLLTVLNTYLIE